MYTARSANYVILQGMIDLITRLSFSRARSFVMRRLICQKSFHPFSEFIARFRQGQPRPRVPQIVPRRQVLQTFGQSTIVVQNVRSRCLPLSYRRSIQFSVSIRVTAFRQTVHHPSQSYSSAESGPKRFEKRSDEHVHG